MQKKAQNYKDLVVWQEQQTTNELIVLDDIRRMLNGLRRKLGAAL